MILSYRDKKTQAFAEGQFVKAFQGFEAQAAKRLAILNAAPDLDTLRALPSNRLEELRGDRAGRYSIRINQSSGVSASSGLTASQDHQTLKSWTTTEERRVPMFMRAVHPGLVLKDELAELNITPTEFARQIDVPPNRVSQIITGKRSITGDTALRFGHWFGTDPHFWINLQAQYDLAVAGREVGEGINRLPTRAGLPPQPEQSRLV